MRDVRTYRRVDGSVYYALAGRHVVLLLVGGDKRRQRADIASAADYWQDWQRRNAT